MDRVTTTNEMVTITMSKKQQLLRRVDNIIETLKTGIGSLEQLLDDLDKMHIDTRSFRVYVLNHLKAYTSDDYGFIENETIDKIYEAIDKELDDEETCETDEDNEDDDE